MAGRNYDNNGYDGERYERYNFNATEDDYIVSDILINLEALIHKSDSRNSHEPEPEPEPEPISWSFKLSSSYEPSWSIKARNIREPLWHNKKKRSAVDSPPSPPRVQYAPPRIKTGDKKEENMAMVYSPSSPLSYEHQLKNKSKKRKEVKDWKERVEELVQTKQQLKLSLDNVKRYHQTLLELNTKLKAKRDEKNGELKRKNLPLQVNRGFDPNFQTGHHQFPKFPVFARQQQQQHEYAHQQGGGSLTFQYYPVPFFQANNKVLQAAEARHRRKIKINTKKHSSSLGIRSSVN